MMRTVFGLFIGVLATLGMYQTHISVARAALVLGTFDSTRETQSNFDGPFSTQSHASLLSHFPGISIVTAPTLTPQFLAGLNELVITSADTVLPGVSPLSASEQSAMLNYVLAGGRVFIIADGFSPFIPSAQSMVGPFGVTIADDNLSGVLVGTPSTHSHPVINGPFGDTSTILMFGAGVFTNLGPAVSLATNGNNQSVLAVIESHVLGPNSGRVVMFTDSDTFIDTAAGGFFGIDESLFLNTIQFLAPVPEPSGLTLAAIAGGGALLAIARNRRRRAMKPRSSQMDA